MISTGSSGSVLTTTSERDLLEDENPRKDDDDDVVSHKEGGIHNDDCDDDVESGNSSTLEYPTREVTLNPKDEEPPPPSHSNTMVNVPEGWRYFLQAGQLSLMGISLLAFCLVLSIWNTWRSATYVLSPLPESIALRCLLNIVLCFASMLVIVFTSKWKDGARGVRVLGNVLGGIGLWELVESLVSYSTGLEPLTELIIYASLLVLCGFIVSVLYKVKQINVIDSSLLSPV